jgi:hypothetical protein
MNAVSFKENVLMVSLPATRTAPTGVPARRITGWGEGDDVFMGERNEDAITFKVGADGAMTVNINANRSGKITLKLMESSPDNAYLSYIHGLQGGGVGTFAPINLLLMGLTTQDRVGGVSGFIQKHADYKAGNGVQEREWVIIVEDYEVLLGRRA